MNDKSIKKKDHCSGEVLIPFVMPDAALNDHTLVLRFVKCGYSRELMCCAGGLVIQDQGYLGKKPMGKNNLLNVVPLYGAKICEKWTKSQN